MTQATANNLLQGDRQSRDRALFDTIAEHYAHKDLHPVSSLARRQRLLRTLDAVTLPDRPAILEAGCGAGFSASYLDGRYGTFVGVDYSDKLIDSANKHNAGNNTAFIAANIKDLDMHERFDAVVMIGVLHHMDDMSAAMAKLVETLKPGGWLLANEPQPGNPLVAAARRARKYLDGEYSDEQDELNATQLHTLYYDAGLADVGIIPQGLLSTPFAEVPMGPAWLTRPLAKACCMTDTLIERSMRPLLGRVSWNLIARGRKL